MRITTTRQKLLDAVLVAERIVGKKETLPVLSCVLLEVDTGCIVRATNLEAGIEIPIPCEVSEKGVVAVPATVLSQTLRSTTGEKVVLTMEEGNLLLEARGGKTLIKAIAHDEFPSIGKDIDGDTIPLSREKLLQGMQSVIYAASPSMIRPELGSVYMTIQDKALTCVATDSFRLAEKRIAGACPEEVDADILLPLKHAVELSHVLNGMASETVEVSIDDSQLAVADAGVRYVSRVIDGTFPNYKEIIPKQRSVEATVLKGDLVEVLRKARVFAGNDQHVGFHVYPKKKLFTMTARSNEVGEMSDTIDAALSGDDLDINFHIGYLSDCLTSIASDSVVLSFAGLGKPLIIHGVSDASFTYLVMPLNR